MWQRLLIRTTDRERPITADLICRRSLNVDMVRQIVIFARYPFNGETNIRTAYVYCIVGNRHPGHGHFWIGVLVCNAGRER